MWRDNAQQTLMLLVPIQVECYSGYKADETPRRFCFEGEWVEIVDVVDRWYQGAGDPEWPIADYFKVADGEERFYLIKHDRESDAWYFCPKW